MLIILVLMANNVSAQFPPMKAIRVERFAADTQYNYTGCGIPSVHPLSYRRAVMYFDSCNAKSYWHNPKTNEWTEIGGAGNTESATQTFTGDGETYDFTISTPSINNFSAPVYLDYHPGDELPATQGANSVTLHYNLPPPDGQSFTVKIIYTTTAP